MNPSALDLQRRMVPRWRSLSITLQARELGSPVRSTALTTQNGVTPPDLLTRMERWRLRPSLVTAAELIEACIVEGREREAVDAARRLVTLDRDAAPLLRQQAAGLLRRTGHGDVVPDDLVASSGEPYSPRLLTRVDLHNPLAWVELALVQTIRGSSGAAERSMRVALSLSPNNRHVLRSAARLFLHLGDPERALETIRRSAATRSDPWLVSSEISIASVAGRSSNLLKVGTSMLTANGSSPRQITELASAVATEEMISGNRKKSKRGFAQSMIDPTGSALAQGEWASPHLGVGELVPETRLHTTFENAEAVAFHSYRLRRFADVRDACENWHGNDPFSTRPFEFGSASAGYIEDFATALDFARRGLAMKPTSPTLLNAFAFASASLDQIDEAAAALTRISLSDVEASTRLIAAANRGLIAFRRGDETAGRQNYAEAIDGFRRNGLHEFSARARIYLAREAIRSSTADWPHLLKEAQEAMKKCKDTEGIPTLRILEKQAEDKAGAMLSSNISQSEQRKTSSDQTVKVTFTVKV